MFKLEALLATTLAIMPAMFCGAEGARCAAQGARGAVKAAGKNTVKARQVDLESSANGLYRFTVAPGGIKIDSKAFDLSLMAKAPTWRVYAVRAREREIASCSLEQFKKMVVPSFTMAGVTQELKKPSRQVDFVDRDGDGHTRYIFDHKSSSELFWQSGKEAQKDAITGVEIDTMKLPVAKEAEPIMYRFLNLPALTGVPAGVVTVHSGGRGWQLRTTAKKAVEVDSALFDPPKGYRDRGLIEKGFLGKTAMRTLEGISDLLDLEK